MPGSYFGVAGDLGMLFGALASASSEMDDD